MKNNNQIQNSIVDLISQRRRQLIVHSVIYYKYNDNIVSDSKWSEWAKELVELQEKYPDESNAAVYSEMFRGFDGSTGFDLAENADGYAYYKARQLMNSLN